MSRLLIALSMLLLLVGINPSGDALAETYGEALSQRLATPVEELKIAGRPAFALLPMQRSAAGPQPWVMYAPALPEYPDEAERWMHQRIVSAGVAVAGIDIGEAYGSPRGQAAMSALYDELVREHNFAPRPCVFGRSRGGLWALSWAAENPDKTSGIAGIYPAFDLRSYPGIEKAASAYEVSADQLQQQLAQLNPIEQVGALVKAKIPAMFIHGVKDEVVPFEPNVGEFSRRYRAAGAGNFVTVLAIEGQGHNFWEGFFRSEKLVDFAIARAKAGADAEFHKKQGR
jgi:pimeloyl-ACP methyl ester carboxylesterase